MCDRKRSQQKDRKNDELLRSGHKSNKEYDALAKEIDDATTR
jgi:hypothetical protein